jgi:hypothetical protein
LSKHQKLQIKDARSLACWRAKMTAMMMIALEEKQKERENKIERKKERKKE